MVSLNNGGEVTRTKNVPMNNSALVMDDDYIHFNTSSENVTSGSSYNSMWILEQFNNTLNSSYITNDNNNDLYPFNCTNIGENGTEFGNTSCRLSNNFNRTGDASDVSDKNYWALSLVLFPILTLFGNILVILSVQRERTLQSATNYFIVSLAVADLLVAGLVMPFAVYVLVNGSWALPGVVCDFYIAMDVTCSTSSIFNLVAISIDRYIAVTQPIKYAKHKNNRRVWLTIALVWVISMAIGSPIVLGLNNTPDRAADACLFYNSDFIIYSSLSSFYIPCIIMVFLYYNIFKALRNRARKARAARKTPQPDDIRPGSVIENVHASTRRLAETALGPTPGSGVGASLLVPGAALVPVAMDEGVTNTGSGSADEDDLQDDLLVEQTPPHAHIIANDKSTEFILATVVEEAAPITTISDQTEARDRSSGSKKERKASAAARFTIYKVNKASRKKREKSSAKKERKATKTLAIVLGVFLICWVPFFTCNIMDAMCSKLDLDCQPGVAAFLLTTWLGYMNSFVNPVIYTIFNPEFRKAFKKIMHIGP